MIYPTPQQKMPLSLENNQEAVFLQYLPGTSKGNVVVERILQAAANGIHVTVIDSGYSYKRLAELMRGQYISFQNAIPRFNQESYGNGPITVFELSRCYENIGISVIQDHLLCKPRSLLVIDEIWRAKMILRDWYALLKAHIRNGGSYVICYNANELNEYHDMTKLTTNNVFIDLCASEKKVMVSYAKFTATSPDRPWSNMSKCTTHGYFEIDIDKVCEVIKDLPQVVNDSGMTL